MGRGVNTARCYDRLELGYLVKKNLGFIYLACFI